MPFTSPATLTRPASVAAPRPLAARLHWHTAVRPPRRLTIVAKARLPAVLSEVGERLFHAGKYLWDGASRVFHLQGDNSLSARSSEHVPWEAAGGPFPGEIPHNRHAGHQHQHQPLPWYGRVGRFRRAAHNLAGLRRLRRVAKRILANGAVVETKRGK